VGIQAAAPITEQRHGAPGTATEMVVKGWRTFSRSFRGGVHPGSFRSSAVDIKRVVGLGRLI
jgi:hypothetical protein